MLKLEDKIFRMPKVELHLHLDGTVRTETIIELSNQQGIALPTEDVNDLKQYLQVSDECKSLGEYLEKFEFPLAVMQTYDALERIAYELCGRAAAENVRYFEVRFAPQHHTREGLALDDIVQAVLDGLNEGQIEFDIKAGLILCAMRHHPIELNLAIVDLAIDFKDKGVVGIDLAGDEYNYPLEGHTELFAKANKNGLHITIHAGEATGAESVAKAMELGAERIGHGVTVFKDPRILARVKTTGVLLEICPKSNQHTRAIDTIAEHPVKDYFDYGVKVSINTDNPMISDTSLTGEYLLMINELGFTLEEVKQMVVYAAEAAFLSNLERDQLVRDIKQELTKIV